MRTCPKCERRYPPNIEICPLDGTALPPGETLTDSDLPGSLARRYRILKRLGEGGMGTVFLAEQIAVGDRPVALKVLLRKLLDDPDFLMRFRNEAGSTGRIHHPNVVTVYESGQAEDGTPYIAMEFLEGEPLSQALRARGPLPLAECTEILSQTARGLHAAHKLGIIHRDLKPDNIFLTRADDGELLVKVVDFGIAKLLDTASHNTMTGVVLGTPAYMSAEHASGMRGEELDARADVYSLGIVVYEMLTGRTPFCSDTPLGVIRMHTHEIPPPLATARQGLVLPPRVERAVMKALLKDRNQRYATTIDFAREFAQAAAQPLPAPPAPVPVVAPPRTEGTLTPPPQERHVPPSGPPPSPPSPAPRSSQSATSALKPAAGASPSGREMPSPAASGSAGPKTGPEPGPPALGGIGRKNATPTTLPPVGPITAPTSAITKLLKLAPPLTTTSIVVLGAGVVLLGVAVGLWLHANSAPPGMVFLPGGTFTMGCDKTQEAAASPPHLATVAAFYLDRVPVTNAQYLEFVQATRAETPQGWMNSSFTSGQESWPVTGVSWAAAAAYANWKGKRLPSETEWEYAARGSDGRFYPWGSNFNPNFTNSAERGLGHPEPVGAHRDAASPFGILDMSGNVWQWCADAYQPYAGSPARLQIPPDSRALRGGSFDSDRDHVAAYTRNFEVATSGSSKIGFRCAKSP